MSSTAVQEKPTTKTTDLITPQWHQHAKTIQKFGTVIRDLPIALEEDVRLEVTKRLNLLLADTAVSVGP